MSQILDNLRDKIRCKISGLNFNTWFNQISDAYEKEDAFCLKVPNKFVADWIGDYYTDALKECLFSIYQKNYKIVFEVTGEGESAIGFAPIPQPIPKVRCIEQLNTKLTFDKFVVGGSNEFAHAASKAVADLPGERYNPLFIYGGTGLGKTHLLHSIGIEIQNKRPDARIIYMSAEKFMNELINALRYEKMPDFRTKFRNKCDVFLIDDVQFIGGKEFTQDEFFHTFNELHDAHRQIVVTSDKLPKDILGLEERLRSRLEWGLVADIQPPDLETRIAILKKKAELQNLSCPDDVAMFLASSITSNVRELEGSLIRLNAFASLAGSEMNVDFAREVLGNSLRDERKTHSIESVQKIVAHFYNINVSDLKSPNRSKNLSYPRQIAMYLCKKYVRTSFPDIGGKFGGKDHTTVMYACRKIEKLMETDSELRSEISKIEKSLLN